MDSDTLQQDLSEDDLFRQYSTQTNKTFMQGIGPWFFCHLSTKNWGNSEDGQILVDKWENVLKIKPDFVEMVTWNGNESTYLAPPDSPVIQQFYPWATLSHSAFLDLSSYYHQAFKTGKRPKIIRDKLYYYYRTHSKNAIPSNDTLGVPVGGAQEDDDIYVVSMLSEPGTVVITSGKSSNQFTVTAGINKLSMPFQEGKQTVALKRKGHTVMTSTGHVEINNKIRVLNFNVYTNFVEAPRSLKKKSCRR
ncbi:glycoside hydrolase [Endogone sp. FLAS-F59071]|nr:glycoside hydrolase [Endogone sp. FLAS-F59071]|eukprot:RUS15998.1 glycoside hydrolase [Endogone sp. FLAS-F59071]